MNKIFLHNYIKKQFVKSLRLKHHKKDNKQSDHLKTFPNNKIPIKSKFNIIGAAEAAANLL